MLANIQAARGSSANSSKPKNNQDVTMYCVTDSQTMPEHGNQSLNIRFTQGLKLGSSVIAISLLMGAANVSAQTIWQPVGGSEAWDSASNWSDGIPDSNTDVTIDVLGIVSAPRLSSQGHEAGTITIGTTGTGGNLVIASGGELTAGAIVLGAEANGVLNLQANGALTTNGDSILAQAAGLELTAANVRGTWTHTGALDIGVGGSAAINIMDGGQFISTGAARSAIAAGSSAEVLISGANSAWTHNGDFSVGADNGEAQLTISSGGSFSVTEGLLTVGENGEILVGAGVGTTPDTVGGILNVGDVVVDGRLLINQAQDAGSVTLGGTLSGSGEIFLNRGRLELDGNNEAFAGVINLASNDTTAAGNFPTRAHLYISGNLGAEAINANLGAGGALSGTGLSYLTLQGEESTYTVAADINGYLRSFGKNGNSTAILSGDNTFLVSDENGEADGSITISAGTIQISSDGNLGDARNAVMLNGGSLATTASFETNRDFNLNNVNSGFNVASGTTLTIGDEGSLSGNRLNLVGGGTLDITEANASYTGGVQVSSGTLVGNSSSLIGNINNAGTVEFVEDNDDEPATYSGTTSGDGLYVKDGIGELILAAQSNTDWEVRSGELTAAAANFGGNVSIDAGAGFNLTGTGNQVWSNELSGAGDFNKLDNFTLTLTGDNADFEGETFVNAGRLNVGDSAHDVTLGGDVSVAGNAALGGTGTIGGNVSVADAGMLVGEQGSTLSIGGNVSLSEDAIVSVALGAPGKGDPRTGINDALFDVGGSLDLNGTLQITNNTDDAGGFRGGVYRIFDYDGGTTLGGEGLSFDPGATGGADIDQMHIQTSVAGQVNLINTTGLDMHFWDGTTGIKDDGLVQGGVGTWTLGGRDWAESTYAINGGWGQDGFAVFQGTGGIVSVDGTAGIRASGLQFTVDGYEIAGGSLTLTEIDGEDFAQLDADGGVSATISASLAGDALIDKGGAGTIVLAGDNSEYDGNARVSEGTLLINNAFGGSVEVGSLGGTGSLGGIGDIAGIVTVRDGSRLIGNQGNSAPLTMGELILEEGSIVDVTLNAPDGSPGLFLVNGDVTLDGGIIDVTTGTGFGRGVYRIIDYTGERLGNDDGLTVADGTGGYDYAVQLADADKQINLVVGSNIAFWNGSVENPTGGITGGSGTWRADTRTNWTNADGDLGHSWEQDLFAVFQGQSGTVTVDDGQGVISVSGMQFFADGYTLVGDAITLNGEDGQTSILVGDGTDAGRDYTAVIGSELSGDSSLVKGDLGTLILTGENTYSGGSVVEAGLLVLGNGGSTGSIVGDVSIESGAGFAFNRSDEFTFGGVLSGAGTVGQVGSGTTTLSNNSSGFAGTVEVLNGGLHVTGALGGLINVRDGALLDGSGAVGNVVVHEGGTIGAGTSGTIGEFNVGNLAFNAGSSYLVNVAANGDGDLLLSSGDVVINGGLVDVRAGSGNYADQTRYTIITAEDGVTRAGPNDGFDQVTSDLAFLTPSLEYDDNNVYLVMDRNDFSFCLPGSTANQCATGEGAESTGPGNPIYDAIVQLNDPQARDAFDQTSGELHASIQTGLLENSRFVRDATGNRIHNAFGQSAAPGKVLVYAPGIDIKDPTPRPVWVDADKADGLALWAHGYGSWGSIDGDGNAASMDTRIGGLFVGADVPVFGNMRLGVVGGYGQSSFSVDDRNSSGTSDNIDLGIYGGGQWDQLGISFGVNHTWHSIDTNRSVAFPGLVDSLSASYDARTTQIYGDVGYTIDVGGVSLEPFAGLAHVRLDRDGFNEAGGAAALTGSSNVIDATFTTLGVRLESTFQVGELDVTASGMAGWRHTLDQVTPTSTHAFAGGDAFTVSGVPLGQDVAVFEAGLSAALNENLDVGVSYSGQFGSGIQDQGLRGNLSWKF